MKVPTPQKVALGYRIQLRLGGKSIPVLAATAKECKHQAELIKSQYLAESKLPTVRSSLTLTKAIDEYISANEAVLSPSTVRGYRGIQRRGDSKLLGMNLSDISEKDWQAAISRRAKDHSPKTVENEFRFFGTVYRTALKKEPPRGKLPQKIKKKKDFLQPSEVLKFVEAVKGTKIEVPALLALSSLRASEIAALRWEDIPHNPDFIRVQGAVVLGDGNKYIRKETNKNESSTRSVPIFIPQLKEALERERKESGPVLCVAQNTFLRQLKSICEKAEITVVGIHDLRRSFASLAYHLQIPIKIAAQIGGWGDYNTMLEIYAQVSEEDITRYSEDMANFYAGLPQNSQANHKQVW